MQLHARRITLALALSLNAAAALSQTHQFEPEPARPWHYHLPGTMTAIAAGNLDADADLELITADETTSPGSILISVHDPAPGGGYTATQISSFPQTSLEATPIEFELVDLDQDSDLDLLIGVSDSTLPFSTMLCCFENDGAGNLTAVTTINLPNMVEVHFDVDDYDGDGDLDIVLSSLLLTSGIVPLQLYAQVAPFQFALQPAAMPATPSMHPVFADIDGDGDKDIAAIGPFAALLVFTNHNGVFTDTVIGSDASYVIGDDLDGDGDVDLMVQRRDSSVDVLLATGGTLTPSNVLTRYTLPYRSPEFADLDGDNDLDAMVFADGQLLVLRNDGTANFAVDPIAPCSFAEPADIDSDGVLDLLLLVSGGITPAYSRPTGMALDPALLRPTNPTVQGGTFFDTADFNGDLAVDLLYGDGSLVHIRQNLSCGEWRPHTISAQIDYFTPRAADIDGDGDEDIVMVSHPPGSAPGGLQVLRNEGDFTFVPLPPQSLAPGRLVGEGDFDGDGRTDLLLSSSGSLRVLRGTANCVFAPPATIHSGGSPSVLGVVDFDNDQDLDILLPGGPAGCVLLLGNDGNGNFSVADPCVFVDPYGHNLTFVDIDGDGDTDAFASTYGVGQLLHNDSGTFTPGQLLNASSNVLDTALFADWDADGDVDLLHAPGSNEDLWLQDNNGVFTNEASVRQLPGGAPTAAAADLDGDGDVDRVPVYGFSPGAMTNHQRSARSLQVPTIGGAMRVQFAHEPGYGTGAAFCVPVLSLAQSSAPSSVPGFEGLSQIDLQQMTLLPYLVLAAPNYVQVSTFAIPQQSTLLGIDLYAQGVMLTDVFAWTPAVHERVL